jgi:hypothetical protein
MSKSSVVGLVGITMLSALMLLFSFLFNQYGESNVSLILLFAGIAMAAVLVLIVLFQKDSENNYNQLKSFISDRLFFVEKTRVLSEISTLR